MDPTSEVIKTEVPDQPEQVKRASIYKEVSL